MEGPYAVDLQSASPGMLRLCTVGGIGAARVVEVETLPLLKDAASAAEDLLQACVRAGDSSSDVLRLESALAALDAHLKLGLA